MLTVDDVRAFLGLDPADTGDDAWLASCVNAVNGWVNRLPVVVDAAGQWSPEVTLGATMLAGHAYQTRGAPMGRAMFDSVGGFQQAYADPEISRYLQLRRWAKPRVTGL